LPYAAMVGSSDSKFRCALQSGKSAKQRRFELARALGDIIWQRDDCLAPITRAKTDRQKFQRAFAQSFLCPFDDLMAYIGHFSPNHLEVREAARHFHVSEALINTVLVNKHVFSRDSLQERLEVV